ncbi:DedA family protein [Microbacterium radiodurans]|uniref:DedA family protein n=1 Tax=Microbacterium radiodurans TaxID=661398 RepID=A0A5J5IU04_9MICO|nr:DedA family protein [Microbacterium radiodurans]KAA9086794.1 DedA family protein [Microbacterium radiodurans]
MNEILDGILNTVQSIDPVLRTIVAGIAIMLETSVLIGLIVPGDTVVIVAATAVDGVGEGIVLAAVVVVGALTGESIGFFLGRWLGPRFRFSRLGRRIGERNWVRSELYLRRRGGPAIFLSRFLPILHSLVPLTVGMSGYSYRRFLAWTTPACIIWSSLYVGVVAAAANTYREVSDNIQYAGYLFVAVIVAFLLLVVLIKKTISRREARHLATARDASPDGDGMKD